MPMKHSIYDSDTHYSIDPITRKFKNESSKKTTLIQGDHNSERFTFEIPRYVEGHDMSLCDKVEVHYINADSKTKESNPGVYEVDDLQVYKDDENIVIFSWLISGNATRYAGGLIFLVSFKCFDDQDKSKIEYHWSTSIYTGITISSGMNNTEFIVEEYSDVLEQWKQEIFSSVDDKVNKQQGTENAGKVLGINEDGIVLPIEIITGSENCFEITPFNPNENEIDSVEQLETGVYQVSENGTIFLPHNIFSLDSEISKINVQTNNLILVKQNNSNHVGFNYNITILSADGMYNISRLQDGEQYGYYTKDLYHITEILPPVLEAINTIPTAISQLENDSEYVTVSEMNDAINNSIGEIESIIDNSGVLDE